MNIVGVGVILETRAGVYLFQERDHNTQKSPGMIAPFGGAMEEGESPEEAAKRELHEELGLVVGALQEVGIFESHNLPGTYLQMFLAKDIQPEGLVLHEGKSIVRLSLEAALAHAKVTDFTKAVLRTL